MCDKAVDTQPTTIKYVSECYKTQEVCNKQFIDVFVFDYISDQYKTLEKCHIVVILFLF